MFCENNSFKCVLFFVFFKLLRNNARKLFLCFRIVINVRILVGCSWWGRDCSVTCTESMLVCFVVFFLIS